MRSSGDSPRCPRPRQRRGARRPRFRRSNASSSLTPSRARAQRNPRSARRRVEHRAARRRSRSRACAWSCATPRARGEGARAGRRARRVATPFRCRARDRRRGRGSTRRCVGREARGDRARAMIRGAAIGLARARDRMFAPIPRRRPRRRSQTGHAFYDPSRDLGPLFDDVQNARVFPDSKTFVDARPLSDPASIVASVRRASGARRASTCARSSPRTSPRPAAGRRGRTHADTTQHDGGAHPRALAVAHARRPTCPTRARRSSRCPTRTSCPADAFARSTTGTRTSRCSASSRAAAPIS